MPASLDQLRTTRNALPVRPSADEVEQAHREIAHIDCQLIQDLEHLMLTPCPPQLEQAQFGALQALRESRLRKDAALAQRAPLAVVDLEEQHRHYDALTRAAERALFLTPQDSPPAMVPAASHGEGPAWQAKGASRGPVDHLEETSPHLDASANERDLPSAPNLASPPVEETEQRAATTEGPALAAPVVAAAGSVEDVLARAAASECSSVDLSRRGLDFWPAPLSGLAGLRELALAENRLLELPDSLGGLTALRSLALAHNKLEELPDAIGELCCLTALDVRANCLEELPPTLGRCAALRSLEADKNKLKALPEAIGQLAQLETLRASLNHLTALPAAIGGCAALTLLDVHFNELREVPAALANCSNLRKLDLGSNFAHLRVVPAELGALTGLEELTLSHNSLKHLPDTLGQLQHLKVLRLEKNPLRYPSKEIVDKGKDAVLSYLVEQRALKDAERRVAEKRGSFSRLFSKMVRQKSKAIDRVESIDDLKRLA